MANIDRSIELDVPLTAAYQAWTRFETFDAFMDDVQKVERLGEGRYRWTGDIGFGPETWEMQVLEAIPDLLISWESASRRHTAATASFSSYNGHTVLKLTMSYDPEGVPAREGTDHRQIMGARLDRDLRRFKSWVEARAPAQTNPQP